LEIETPVNNEPHTFTMPNISSQVSRKTVVSPGSARRSKHLLRNLKTPPIPLPSMSPDIEDVSITHENL